MIEPKTYYQKRIARRYYQGKITQKDAEDAIEQNNAGRKLGHVVQVKFHAPAFDTAVA